MDSSVENTKYIEKIKNLRLLDDAFFGICIAEDDELIELILRILMNKADLKVLHSRNQYQIKNLLSHSAVLDVYAIDGNGRFYNIEVQRNNDGAYPQRARYYSSILDVDIL